MGRDKINSVLSFRFLCLGIKIVVTKEALTSTDWTCYWGQWLSQAVDDQESQIHLEVLPLPGWKNPSTADEPESGSLATSAERILVEKPLVSGFFEKDEEVVVGRFTINGDNPDGLDGLLSLTLGMLCEERGDLLLHSSAVLANGNAYLFLGHGGAGKTTIAVELNGGRTPMSVDRTLVTFDEDGTAIAHSTPFGDRNRDLSGPLSGPVAGIFFIEQAAEHEVLPVDPFEATKLILAQTIAPTRNRDTVQKVMDAVGRLVDGVPCHRLRFKKDDGFWPLIEDVLAK